MYIYICRYNDDPGLRPFWYIVTVHCGTRLPWGSRVAIQKGFYSRSPLGIPRRSLGIPRESKGSMGRAREAPMDPQGSWGSQDRRGNEALATANA